jgi:hypothetical protein
MRKTIAGGFLAIGLSAAFGRGGTEQISAPRFWNDRDLADWATPVAGLNLRPGHYSDKEYYAAPVGEWVRTYPVYFPGREPEGYWNMLRSAKSKPLLTPGARSSTDWIKDGKRVFGELDIPELGNYDPKLVRIVRSADEYKKLGGHPRPDSTVSALRWVPTFKGLALGILDCGGCHSRLLPGGEILDGAPANETGDGVISAVLHSPTAESEPLGAIAWRSFGVPWLTNEINEKLKSLTPADRGDFGFPPAGVTPRFNGSPFYPTKMPDLIGIKDRRSIDHTATHRLRGPEDLMRYAALVRAAISPISDRIRCARIWNGGSLIASRTICYSRWHNTSSRCRRHRTRTSEIPEPWLERRSSTATDVVLATHRRYTRITN